MCRIRRDPERHCLLIQDGVVSEVIDAEPTVLLRGFETDEPALGRLEPVVAASLTRSFPLSLIRECFLLHESAHRIAERVVLWLKDLASHPRRTGCGQLSPPPPTPVDCLIRAPNIGVRLSCRGRVEAPLEEGASGADTSTELREGSPPAARRPPGIRGEALGI